jgi:methylase of polypeptide subunit release factors
MPVPLKIALANEHELIGVALALISNRSLLSPQERIAASGIRASRSAELIEATRSAIKAGLDPLGDALIHLRSAKSRRALGAVYTPPTIIRSMMAWSVAQGEPERVVDPGAGTGRFLMAAAGKFPRASLVGIELDPVAALLLRGNVAALRLQHRAKIIVGDYRAAAIPDVSGRTLYIGNPPYVRHHNISTEWKDWYGKAAASFHVPGSKLAGLHLHFYLRTLQLAKHGDFGTFITSSEWLDVNYGQTLRSLLVGKLGGASLHVLEPGAMPFADAMTTGAIACFRIGEPSSSMCVRAVPTIEMLNGLSFGTPVSRTKLNQARRWSVIVKPTAAPPPGFIELGELCAVHRGQVTGANAVWIAGNAASHLPERVLRPTVTRAREIIAADGVLRVPDGLRKVIDLPSDLGEFSSGELRRVKDFLRWAKYHGAADSYVAQHRRAWWAVRLYEPAPIVCTYMGRRPPEFAQNLCGARHINIAHGLYPRATLSNSELAALVAYLRRAVRVSSGRTYAGGLTKFEPKELERIPIPPLAQLLHENTADLGSRAAHH